MTHCEGTRHVSLLQALPVGRLLPALLAWRTAWACAMSMINGTPGSLDLWISGSLATVTAESGTEWVRRTDRGQQTCDSPVVALAAWCKDDRDHLLVPRRPERDEDVVCGDDAGGRETLLDGSALLAARPGTGACLAAGRDAGSPARARLPARYRTWNVPLMAAACHYCPEGGETAVPCPRGTFGPGFWATDIRDCIVCPPHHYTPREGLDTCLPCGPRARQPLPGQDRCACLGEGQVFQPSDGQCHCALGYRATQTGDGCQMRVYEICRDGRVRDQDGECLGSRQWAQHCSQVCASPGQYEGYDTSLGLCVCATPDPEPVRSECVGGCGDRPAPPLQLVCSAAQLRLYYTLLDSQMKGSRNVLLSVLKRWDSAGRLKCEEHLGFSRPVYAVQTGEAGLFGLLHSVPADVRMLVLENGQEAQSSAEAPSTHRNHTHMDVNSHWSTGSTSRSVKNRGIAGVMNPTACLHLDDILLFTVSKQHYPQYDVENLFNTNAAFDWGPFRLLAQELTMAQTAHSLFSVSFSEPGVYTLTLSSNRHKRMYIKVLPSGGECYDPGPFFPTDPHHMTRMGLVLRRDVSLRPDWLAIRGILAGVVALLCLCIALMVLFREHVWPEKLPAQAGYRALQLKYNMDDYASKGSRVKLLKKTHRNLQVGLEEESGQRAVAVLPDEFWDYEEQVDLEAFSSSTFYDILLKHSVSVTACLGQLRGEVKQLYQRVIAKVQALHPAGGVTAGSKMEALERQVEQETARRKALGVRLTQLLDSQLQTLYAELQPQNAMHMAFTAALRESTRLLSVLNDNHAPLWDPRILQSVKDRVAVLAEEMADLVSVEAQRQGAWVVLKQGTGARLLCPASGVPLATDDIIAPDGTVRACDAVRVDPCTGLIMPNSNTHMLLASGHSLPVPPDFFLHPQTGRVLPVAGNVSFDPTSSTLVYTADACVGGVGKWDYPLLPYVPYPPSRHAQLPGLPKLRGLRAGQKMVFGGPMCDYDTGVLVPILAVTIHPQTGVVLPLGGVHVCPVSRMRLPIQIGGPMLDTRTGGVVLITGVTLDPQTGVVLPVGGLLLGEPFIEPLSGRPARVGGGSLRGGKVVPHGGGFQALLDCQALVVRMRLVEQVWAWHAGRSPGALELCCRETCLQDAVVGVEQAWRASQHCITQLLCRLEAQRAWARKVEEDGGSLGEVKLPGSELGLPALPGMEYPDPGGSCLSVPVLGAQLDWVSGCVVPLAGTMEDPEGKGLVPIRLGTQTVDPVTGVLGPVVGARLDVWKRTVVPVTVSQCVTVGESPDCVLVEALQEECSVRGRFWRDQGTREEELVADLDRALRSRLGRVTQEHLDHLVWTDVERQLKKAVAEIQEASHAEAQRRSSRSSELFLLLPAHVLLTLTRGDEEEWEYQRRWHTELSAVLNRVSVFMAQWQWRPDQPDLQGEEPDVSGHQRALWELVRESLSDLDGALAPVCWARDRSQLGADTAQAVLSGSFWYRDYGPTQPSERNPLKEVAMTQRKVLPRLERLVQLLEGGGRLSSRHVRSSESRDVKDALFPTNVPVPKLAGGDRVGLLEVSQLIREVEQQLREVGQHVRGSRAAQGAGLPDGRPSGPAQPFMDFQDAQWKCEGHLVLVTTATLTSPELLNYQHGQNLLQLLHARNVAPAVTLLPASSLPANDYHGNAFRNSFYYQEAEGTLYVRRERLQSVGGLSLLLLHAAAHISSGQLTLDAAPAFQRAFFKVLQVVLGELLLDPTNGDGGDEATRSARSGTVPKRAQRPSWEFPPEGEVELRRVERGMRDGGLEAGTTHTPPKPGSARPATAPEWK
ncbi:uncharacterized protein LOC143477416 [Brachyhypopomus gauderio]|uniref:uncharacterized protein LOC143477416 n=1 Tax=Brachyhypopomus gauderio TaxID=698409 RepID=UPI004042E608